MPCEFQKIVLKWFFFSHVFVVPKKVLRHHKEVWKYKIKLIFSPRLGLGREGLNFQYELQK